MLIPTERRPCELLDCLGSGVAIRGDLAFPSMGYACVKTLKFQVYQYFIDVHAFMRFIRRNRCVVTR